MSADELEQVVGRVWLQTPEMALARSHKRPSVASVEAGLDALSAPRVSRRIEKVTHAISVLHEVEAILADNLRTEWRPGSGEGRLSHESTMTGEKFVAHLDRLLAQVSEFENRWDSVAQRDPKALWRNAWDHAGVDVANAILRPTSVGSAVRV